MSQLPILPPFIPNRTRVANLVPFTYRDSMTMLEKIENLQKYVVEFVPEVNAAVAILIAEFEAINEAQLVEFESRFTDFVDHINALVALINNKTGPVDTQHITLSSNRTLSVDALFPDSHVIVYEIEQSGAYTLTPTGNLTGTILMDPTPGARTVFFAIPKQVAPGDPGQWYVYQPAQEFSVITATIMNHIEVVSDGLETQIQATNQAVTAVSQTATQNATDIDSLEDDVTTIKGDYVPKFNAKVLVGPNAGQNLGAFNIGTNGTVIAIGKSAMAAMSEVKNAIAIGANAQSNGTKSRDNISIGDSSLASVSSSSADYNQSDTSGTRNIAVGGNAGYFIANGRMHTVIGRNAGQNIVGNNGIVAIGAASMASMCPIGLSGEIENWAPIAGDADTAVNMTAVGSSAMSRNIGIGNTAFGANALMNVVNSVDNVAVGPNALRRLDESAWVDGKKYVNKNIAGTYNQSGNTLTLNFAGHGAVVGDIIIIQLLDGGSQTFGGDIAPAIVSAIVSSGVIRVNSPASRIASGSAILRGIATVNNVNEKSSGNLAVGGASLAFLQSGFNNVALGDSAMLNIVGGVGSTAIGKNALKGATGSISTENTAVGLDTLANNSTGTHNVAVGGLAGQNNTTGKWNTAVGHSAGRLVSGTGATQTAFDNTTCLGFNSRVSGSNQVQLGAGDTSVYTYGAVQNRSDMRDKAQVRETVLGLDFINLLEPVDFKWNYREDYEGENDGSKTRTRFHHGVIAQQVVEAAESLGTEFGGHQHHAINGGADIHTIGYEEFISPLIKAIQELTSIVTEQGERLKLAGL